MADLDPDEKSAEKRTQDRSPSFPYIGLSKAIERAEQLYGFTKRHDVRMVDAAKPAWNLGPKSSATLQTVAALISFGLVEASGTGETRKIKLSDLAYRAIADPRHGAREQALAEAALKPKLISEFWQTWRDDRPPEATCIGDLHIDRGFTSDGAKAFLRVYDDTIRYVSGASSDKGGDSNGLKTEDAAPPVTAVSVGDVVRVEVGGQIVVERSAVRAIQEHGGSQYVFVEGQEAGALMSDVTLLEKAPSRVAAPTLPLPDQAARAAKPGWKEERLIDDDGGEIFISYEGEPSVARYEFIRDYLDFKVNRAKKPT